MVGLIAMMISEIVVDIEGMNIVRTIGVIAGVVLIKFILYLIYKG